MSTVRAAKENVMRALLVSMAFLAAACGGVEARPMPGPTLEVGRGLEDGTPGFLPLVEGEDVTLVPGAQGGFHVFINVRVSGDSMAHLSERPLLHREARLERTGELVSKSKHRTPLIAVDEEASTFESEKSIPLFLCPTPIAIPAADEAIILEVEAIEDGEPVKGTIRFVPRCPEGDQKQFCENICYG